MAKWWDSGPGAEERAKKREEEARQRQQQLASRVWQRPGQKCVVTFISSEMYHFAEHQYQQPGIGWMRYACLEGEETEDGLRIPCPFCLSKIKQEFSLYAGTVINHTGFITRDGEKVRHVKQALVVKGTAKAAFLKAVNTIRKANGDSWNHLWTVWEIEREDKPKSITPGIFYEYKGKRSKDPLIKKMQEAGAERDDWDRYLQPYDVERLVTYLAPKEAYALLHIPWTFDTVSRKMLVEEEDYYDDLDFPPAGAEQSTSFTEDTDDEDIPKEGIFDDDDSDAKDIEDYELLK
jgi:hypothetical protein